MSTLDQAVDVDLRTYEVSNDALVVVERSDEEKIDER